MTPDTAALRALAERHAEDRYPEVAVNVTTLLALCDAADEVEGLRIVVDLFMTGRTERAVAALVRPLVAELRALCDKHEHGALRWADPLPVPEWIPLVRAVLDRHAPEEGR